MSWLVLTGLAAGSVHVLSGPDHWMAIAPVSLARPGLSRRIGIKWGIGHAFGTLLLILPFLLIRRLEGLDLFADWAEAMVGVVLVVIGWSAVRNARSVTIHNHSHVHAHDDAHAHGDGSNVHQHMHVHLKPTPHPHPGDLSRHHHGPLFVGALHGVAGSGALLVALPALGLEFGHAIGYLAGYFAGGLITMVCLASAMDRLVRDLGTRSLQKVFLMVGWSVLSLGVYWIGSQASTTLL